MSNIRPTKAYRSREKVRCNYCGKKGRDIKMRPTISSIKLGACNNCARKYF